MAIPHSIKIELDKESYEDTVVKLKLLKHMSNDINFVIRNTRITFALIVATTFVNGFILGMIVARMFL